MDFHWQMTLFDLVRMLWAMAFGACVGSLINVLAYRIPRGLDFVTPTSRCPSCDTKLTWRENIPIFGWLFLRGRCRFCKTPISAEYPVVEACVALLWGLAFMACYSDPSGGLAFLRAIEPEWARNGFVQTWPIFLVLITLLSSLVAMTLVDAKTYTIPPILTNVPTLVALVAHPVWALYIQLTRGELAFAAPGQVWSLWTPGPIAMTDWMIVGAALGTTLGLVVANGLLATGVLRRSFEDYHAWEEEQLATQATARAASSVPARDEGATSPAPDLGPHATDAGASTAHDHPTQQELWIQYPHARREMLRELLFLGPAIALGLAGAALAHRLAGPGVENVNTLTLESLHTIPLWLRVLAGVLAGYLIGGGVVWLFRIAASLAFNKEALGLGDVHMMAAVGACLGWIDPVLAFFLAAFLGMGGFVLAMLSKGKAQRMLPFGPYLALATILIWFAKPALEWAATALMDASPPFNWP